MIKKINSKDLKNKINLICVHCKKEHFSLISEEGVDYLFNRDTETGEEWCICVQCNKKCEREILRVMTATKSYFDNMDVYLSDQIKDLQDRMNEIRETILFMDEKHLCSEDLQALERDCSTLTSICNKKMNIKTLGVDLFDLLVILKDKEIIILEISEKEKTLFEGNSNDFDCNKSNFEVIRLKKINYEECYMITVKKLPQKE